MKTIVATIASMIVLYGLFVVLSYLGQQGGTAANQNSKIITIPDYETPAPEAPQYGGALNIGNVYVTLTALSWDPADWNWKQNQDTGMYFEQLFVADLETSLRKGGSFPFTMQAYLPAESIKGEIAESWKWEDPLTVVIRIRRGIMFPEKPGIMERRELDAEDVVFSFERQADSPKAIPSYFSHVQSVTARDPHTIVFKFNQFNAEWDYRFGYGYYSGILPRELGNVDVKDWRNAVGSGPFQIQNYVDGTSQTYARTPDYWDREDLHGREYEIPFIDQFSYRTIKDKGTWLTAIRTGQLDILEAIDWVSVKHLMHTTPELKWSRWLATDGRLIALRCDQKPFDDVRVRRALNLAVNQQEIKEQFFGGNAELFAFPQKPAFIGYFQPLKEMPDSVQELYSYNPEKAKQLLTDAGYPNGFTFTTQVNSNDPVNMELVPLIVDYLSRVGVTMEVQPMEYAAYLSAMTTRTMGPGYFARTGHVNPTTTLRKNFMTGQTWNMSSYSDPEIDERITEMIRTRDEIERQRLARQLTIDMIDRAPAIWLPIEYGFSAWWPWVKNYNGELRAGAQRPGPIYARIWIDQEMKKEMGFE